MVFKTKHIPWNKGKNHSEETKKKIKIARAKQIMKPFSKERNQKISKALTGRTIPDNVRQKIRETLTGRKLPKGHPFTLKGKDRTIKTWNKGTNICSNYTKGKTYKEIMGEEKAKKRKQQLREQAINGVKYRKGKNETKILNHLQKLFLYKILRQYQIIGYSIDGYIPELNLAIEVDELGHFRKSQKLKDIQRQKEIEEELGCKFLRINEQKYLKQIGVSNN